MSLFSKAELRALAMHEIMKREQQRYADRVREQNKISLMSDESLRSLVEGGDMVATDSDKQTEAVKSAKSNPKAKR